MARVTGKGMIMKKKFFDHRPFSDKELVRQRNAAGVSLSLSLLSRGPAAVQILSPLSTVNFCHSVHVNAAPNSTDVRSPSS